MALPTSKFVLAFIATAALAQPAAAQYYDYLSRSDFISLSAGDAAAANIAIQTPTPWPAYVNDVAIAGRGSHGASIMQKFYRKYDAAQQANPSTVINIGK